MRLDFRFRMPSQTGVMLALLGMVSSGFAATNVTVRSLSELAEYAQKSDQSITLAPGEYQITDFITPKVIKAKRKSGEFALIDFSGSNNQFHFANTTIWHDTIIRNSLRPKIHSDEFPISGNGNTFKDLKLLCKGDGISHGGTLVAITGEGNTLIDARLLCQGSFPYGYGDLFGKGSENVVIPARKHSGLLITGDHTTLQGCHLIMRSFGHGIFMQKDASDVLIENCRVEGKVRGTREMLAERGTIAAEKKFRTSIRTRNGKNEILPGYTKSLSEDAFRTYGSHRNLVIRNCIATHMRGGFEIRSPEPALLENCQAIGCERGFWVGDGNILKSCAGDTQFGPLLYVEGKDVNAELTLLPQSTSSIVHSIANIHGEDHTITIKAPNGRQRVPPLPIQIGYSSPAAGENMSEGSEKPASGIKLFNDTAMPVIIGAKASDCEIESRGRIIENKGEDIKIL